MAKANETQAEVTEEAAPVQDIRAEFGEKILSMMDVIAPAMIDLIFGDYMDARSPEVIATEREVFEKFIGLVKRATQGQNGYDKQLDRIRNLKGSDYVKDVKPFRAPKPAVKSKVDGAKILSDLF